MRSRWLSHLTVLLVLVGISEPVGVLLSMPRLRGFGRLTSSSNSPLVFNQVGGIEFWANRYRFRLTDRNGSSVEIAVTNEALARIRGPHTRTAAYVVPIGLGGIAGPDLYLRPLQHGLCGGGPLARAIGYDRDLAGATIEVLSGSPGDDRRWTLAVPCPN